LEPNSQARSTCTFGHGEPTAHVSITFGILKAAALLLVSLGLLGTPPARATAPRHEEDSGALEHYHHEFYSHSYVDPNYREDLNQPTSGELSKSKTHRRTIKPNTNVSIALGGHRRNHQRH